MSREVHSEHNTSIASCAVDDSDKKKKRKYVVIMCGICNSHVQKVE